MPGNATPEADSWMNLWGLAGSGRHAAQAVGKAVAHEQATQTATAETHAQLAGSFAGRAMHAVNELGAQAYGALPEGAQHALGAVESAREGVAGAVGDGWNWAGKHITETATAADGLARRVGTAADGLADQAIASGTEAVRKHVGDTAANIVHAGADRLHQDVKSGVQFEYGVAKGVAEEGGSMVSGVGRLAGGAYDLTVDPKARERAAAGVASNVTRAAEDPAGVALHAGKGVYKAGAGWVDGAKQASAKGGLPEYLGNAAGHVAGIAATIVAPEALLGKAGEATSLAGKAGDALETGARTGDALAGTERAATAEGAGERATAHVEPEPPPPLRLPTSPEVVAEQREIVQRLAKLPVGSPEALKAADDMARASTFSAPPPGRTVLGKWATDGTGYQELAAKDGGTWYQSADGIYDDAKAAAGGSAQANAALWQTNEAFLRQQLASGMPKIEFVGMDVGKELAVDAERASSPGYASPARVREIRYLQEHAAEYGYRQEGNSFVRAR